MPGMSGSIYRGDSSDSRRHPSSSLGYMQAEDSSGRKAWESRNHPEAATQISWLAHLEEDLSSQPARVHQRAVVIFLFYLSVLYPQQSKLNGKNLIGRDYSEVTGCGGQG